MRFPARRRYRSLACLIHAGTSLCRKQVVENRQPAYGRFQHDCRRPLTRQWWRRRMGHWSTTCPGAAGPLRAARTRCERVTAVKSTRAFTVTVAATAFLLQGGVHCCEIRQRIWAASHVPKSSGTTDPRADRLAGARCDSLAGAWGVAWRHRLSACYLTFVLQARMN